MSGRPRGGRRRGTPKLALASSFARSEVDLADLMRLFAEGSRTVEGRKSLTVAHFRPLATVLDEPAVRELHAAGHEFSWANETQLLARKDEGWRLVFGRDARGRTTILMDHNEELILLHRKIVRDANGQALALKHLRQTNEP